MRGYTWAPAKPRRPVPPRLSDEAREKLAAEISPVLAALKKRFPKTNDRLFNWPVDIFVRWHHNSLYFVVIMKTPHGQPPEFEYKAARITPTSTGKFELAFPMRRGWNTFLKQASFEACLKAVSEGVSF
jgi:hypothetical protein